MKLYKLKPNWWITFLLNGERIIGRTTIQGNVIYITSYGQVGNISFEKIEKPARLFFSGALNANTTLGQASDTIPS